MWLHYSDLCLVLQGYIYMHESFVSRDYVHQSLSCLVLIVFTSMVSNTLSYYVRSINNRIDPISITGNTRVFWNTHDLYSVGSLLCGSNVMCMHLFVEIACCSSFHLPGIYKPKYPRHYANQHTRAHVYMVIRCSFYYHFDILMDPVVRNGFNSCCSTNITFAFVVDLTPFCRLATTFMPAYWHLFSNGCFC